MDNLTKKTFKTSRSLTYTYYHHAGSPGKPTVVLQHGFPDSAHLWQEIVPHLIPTGYPLLIPDLLGYDGTSKPTDTALFNGKAMAADLMEIIDSENISSVISLGHDWGSWMAQRLYLYHPDRVVGMILLNVAYLPPDQENRFDLESALKTQEHLTGNPLYAYWELFTADDAAQLVESRLESFYCVLHGDEPEWMKQMFCVRGAMRAFLEADKRVPLKKYAQNPALKDAFLNRMQRDGLASPFQWYRALASNVQFETEKEIAPETIVFNKPMLFLGCDGDAVCLTAAIKQSIDQGLVPNVKVTEINSAHWCPMEKPQEVGSIIAEYLQNTKFAQNSKF